MEYWDTLPDRLKWAISKQPPDGREKGLRLFQRRMEKRAQENSDLVGYSLSSIQSYLNGKLTPPLVFLQEAATLLGYREAWLISNDGWPTRAHAIATGSEPSTPDFQRTLALDFEKEVLAFVGIPRPEPSPGFAPTDDEGGEEIPGESLEVAPPSFWVHPVREVWLRLRLEEILQDPKARMNGARDGDTSAEEETLTMISKALIGPLGAFEIDSKAMSEERFGEYAVHIVPTLLMLVDERIRQRRMASAGSRGRKETENE